MTSLHDERLEPDLAPLKAALAELTDTELDALIDATKSGPQSALGLLPWLDAACD